MPKEIKCSEEINDAMSRAMRKAIVRRVEFFTPEHFLQELLQCESFVAVLQRLDADIPEIDRGLTDYLDGLDTIPEDEEYELGQSSQYIEMCENAYIGVLASGREVIGVPHFVRALVELEDSEGAWLLLRWTPGGKSALLRTLADAYSMGSGVSGDAEDSEDMPREEDAAGNPKPDAWRRLVTCVNDSLEGRNPLIGREEELERTIQVLCRKDKNNPLHVGEPGVGKTALIYGLARRINEGNVPERLKGSRIYQLDLGTLLAGTQMRGEFEARLKSIMDGAAAEPGSIIYIDEIHNLVGAGATSGNSMDASNMLKPYLEGSDIRFIGSTTYAEYNRYFAKSKGIVRRFQQIDICEPSEEQTMDILRRLKDNYERYHGVVYTDDSIKSAVTGSARHISGRFLPDKAIDLIDEAGAYREIHPEEGAEVQTVGSELISEILARICKVDSLALRADDNAALATLKERICSLIYGQDEAVAKVVEAVQMAKAGLVEDARPLASLLFVGPTGVGKTEVARVLAKETGVELVRFDMSEYAEKHTVAKLIGSPAGYVGYEDGGLLTDAIRKSPNCVLLLDEIEKAHPDIYNILLQVMDYARLTDNKGNKADFRNVILIMTSNAGAQYATQAKVGFESRVTAGEAMMRQVKKTFKPEFLNRLTSTVVFNEMSRDMARRVLDKCIAGLERMLADRKVKLTVSPDAVEWFLERGYSREYGARELQRVVESSLKPLLMREILFGSLREGGQATAVVSGNELTLLNYGLSS